MTVYEQRPWGQFWTLFGPQMKNTLKDCSNRDFAIKVLDLKPNERTSLQYHKGRAEFLVVVGGTGRITYPDMEHKGDLAVVDVVPGICVIIPKEGRHRIEAKEHGMTIAEVWMMNIGPERNGFLSEDDCVRLEDDYGRESKR